MESNKGAAAMPEKEVAAAAGSCFKRTVGEDATLMELAKDQYRQFREAPAADHWACIKNKVSSMLADPILIFGGGGGAKDHGSSSTGSSNATSVEAQ